jgi:hypothetical protein
MELFKMILKVERENGKMANSSNFEVYATMYQAGFVGLEEKQGKFGPCLLWRFRIISGMHEGRIVERMTTNDCHSGTDCEMIFSSLLGRPATDDDQHAIESLINNQYSVYIRMKDEKPRVEYVMPAR